MLNTSINLNMK